MTSHAPVVVLGSAGRRLYFVDWFRDAFQAAQVPGQVIVTEADPTSAAFSAGDRGFLMPRYDDPAFEAAFWEMIGEVRPDIYLPLNDYEIMRLSRGLADELRRDGVKVPGVDSGWLAACADKLEMASSLRAAGVPTPDTVRGDDDDAITGLTDLHEDFVVKHRFGSGSSGVALVPADDVRAAVTASAESAPNIGVGADPRSAVVVQPRVSGQEYGVDIVCSLTRAGDYRGTLARRKLRMRAGETDKASSADASPFAEVAARLSRAIGIRGLVDTDMFLGADGDVSVIDINPRFGGGYPFVHLAGADVPLLYVEEVVSGLHDENRLSYDLGVVSAKYESVRRTGQEAVSA